MESGDIGDDIKEKVALYKQELKSILQPAIHNIFNVKITNESLEVAVYDQINSTLKDGTGLALKSNQLLKCGLELELDFKTPFNQFCDAIFDTAISGFCIRNQNLLISSTSNKWIASVAKSSKGPKKIKTISELLVFVTSSLSKIGLNFPTILQRYFLPYSLTI